MNLGEWQLYYQKRATMTRRRAAKALWQGIRDALLEIAGEYDQLAERESKAAEAIEKLPPA